MVSCRHNLDSFEQKRMCQWWWVCSTIFSTDAIIISGYRSQSSLAPVEGESALSNIHLRTDGFWQVYGVLTFALRPSLSSHRRSPLRFVCHRRAREVCSFFLNRIYIYCIHKQTQLQILHDLIVKFGSFSFLPCNSDFRCVGSQLCWLV